MIEEALRQRGFAFVLGTDMRAWLLAADPGGLADWPTFAASWDDLEVDTHMADGGRYRRRRHAHFLATPDGIARQAHRPHWQSRDYNPLNGGVERWFAPVTLAAGGSRSLATILGWCDRTFRPFAPVATSAVEIHQFRIEARVGHPALPTPEGSHRDGVDHVLVLLVRRTNIASGTTTIHSPAGTELGTFTLASPFDAAVLDDARVYHGVTPVEAEDATRPAYRDVLVVTFRRAPDLSHRLQK